MWWTLFFSFLECNVAPIAFYACVQFGVFVAFDGVEKVGLVVGVVFMFGVCLFSLVFYPLVYRYENEEASSEVLDYTGYKQKSFWL